MKKNIIIDTDMGTDDYIACQLAVLSKKINVEAISLVHGNTSMDNVRNNVFKTLDMIGYNNKIKIYEGESSSVFDYGVNTDDEAHGSNGFGDVSYDVIKGKIESQNAVDMLIEKVNSKKGKISIVAIGPLTNVARAVKKDEKFSKNVKELIIMGGAKESGNITPYAEFNFYKDPQAADIVFNAGFKKIILIDFDVTKKVTLDKKIEEFLISTNDENAKFIYDITRKTSMLDKEKNNTDGMSINDAINVCYLINSRTIKLRKANVTINTDLKSDRLGESVVSYEKPFNCFFSIDINKKKCKKIIFNTILRKFKKQFNKL